jgi:hypothetical protein
LENNNDKVTAVEIPQLEETLSEKAQSRRSFLKKTGKAVYVAPVLFTLSQYASGSDKTAPGRTPTNNTMNLSVTPPPPPTSPPG